MLRTFGLTKEKQYFVENLAMLVSSGMTMVSALESIGSDLRSCRMQRLIRGMREDIEDGWPLWRALDKSQLFAPHVVSLVRIGEESGKLTNNLKLIALQEEKEALFRSKLKSALMYPVFVLTLSLVIGIGIAWFILPRLSLVFAQLHLKLPLITRILIGLGTFLQQYGTIAVPAFFAAIIALFGLFFYVPKTKSLGNAFLFHLPGAKKLIQEVEIARLGYLLGTLLDAGLPVTVALESLARATLFPGYRKLYSHIEECVEDGNSFQKSFDTYPKARHLIPRPVQQMIATGERSGNLSAVLLKISDMFENKTEATTKNLMVILEPVLLVIVWLGVVSVALAVILPIYSLIGGLNDTTSAPASPPPAAVEASEPVPESATTTRAGAASSTPLLVASSTPVVGATSPPKSLEILNGIPYVNVRSGPSTDSTLVRHVNEGDVYEYTEFSDGWYKIILPDGNVGWVNERYAKIVESP